MKILVFDLSGDFAFYKMPEGTRGSYSFPFPPRTSLLGLLAGIIGKKRNSYWKNEDPLNESRIALEILKKPVNIGIKMNYNQTKTIISIFKDIKIILPKNPVDPNARGFTTQVRINYLKDVKYRIYFNHPDEKIYENISNFIRNNFYTFPPYLGHANCLAEIKFIDEFLYENKTFDTKQITLSGIIPLSTLNPDTVGLTDGTFKMIYNVPNKMKINSYNEETDTYEAVLDKLESFIYNEKQSKTPLIANEWNENYFSIKIDGKIKNLSFIPN